MTDSCIRKREPGQADEAHNNALSSNQAKLRVGGSLGV